MAGSAPADMSEHPLPDGFTVVFDTSVRIEPETRTLVGGSPMRILRFSEAGYRLIETLRSADSTDPVDLRATNGATALVRKLLHAGMAHPTPAALPAGTPPPSAMVVIPVFDGNEQIDPQLDVLPGVVVHDGGPHQDEGVEQADGAGHRYLRTDDNRGPAAARNLGAASMQAEVVVFVDTDVEVHEGWLEPLLAHFADPTVGAVAPRILPSPETTLIGRFEAVRSPLDMGPDPARVAADSAVTYVPSTVLLVRTTAFTSLGGFDEELRYGEDVDLVWRLAEQGWTVRYEPQVEVQHGNRRSWTAVLRQRRFYGSAAAHLHHRHPGSVAPVRLNIWSAATWACLALGDRRMQALGVAAAAGSTMALAQKLEGKVDNPAVTAARLGGRGTVSAGRWLAEAVGRTWLPLAMTSSLVSSRARKITACALIGPSVFEWLESRPDIDPITFTALRIVDNAAYCAGVWDGVRATRDGGALLPKLTGIPGI